MKLFGTWKLIAAAFFGLPVLFSVAAEAQGRPDARQMTCEEARSLVWNRGAAVITTGRHTYDRYVANERFCALSHTTKRAFVQTRDTSSCAIGYTCEVDTRDREDRWWWRLRRR